MTDQQPGIEPPPRAPDAALSLAGVTPETARRRQPISGPAKLGSAVLVVFGILWALAGAWLVAVTFGHDDGDMLSPQFVALVGILIVVIALLQTLIGVLAWRGDPVARVMGILYAFVFGLGELWVEVWLRGAPSGVEQPVLVGFAIGYVYTIVVFIFLWHGGVDSTTRSSV
jgi:hypothetical protein